MRRSAATLALAAWASLGAAGCPGDLERVERFASCGPGRVEEVLEASCGSCHDATDPEAGLDLVSPGVEARLLGEVSETPFCEGRLLIDPDAPADAVAAHLMLDKLQDSPSCGSRMPFGLAALADDERECLRRWIDEILGGQP